MPEDRLWATTIGRRLVDQTALLLSRSKRRLVARMEKLDLFLPWNSDVGPNDRTGYKSGYGTSFNWSWQSSSIGGLYLLLIRARYQATKCGSCWRYSAVRGPSLPLQHTRGASTNWIIGGDVYTSRCDRQEHSTATACNSTVYICCLYAPHWRPIACMQPLFQVWTDLESHACIDLVSTYDEPCA